MGTFKQKFINKLKSVKALVISKRELLTRLVALTLCFSCCINTICGIVSTNALGDVIGKYKEQAGTQFGLNSPLLKNEVTAEKFEPWELEVFGIFMSNFCIPLVDSVDSAFGYDKLNGSKGDGLKALQFSCGGDMQAGGIVQNMVIFVMDECASNKKTVYAEYNIYRNGKSLSTSNTDLSKRLDTDSGKAYMYDMVSTMVGFFPMQSGNSVSDDYNKVMSWEVGGGNDKPLSSAIESGEASVDCDVLERGWTLCGYGQSFNTNSKVYKAKPTLASIPTFYIKDASGEFVKVFDLADGWDAQVWALCINYGLYKAAILGDEQYNKSLELFNGLMEYPLSMDACGNITARYNGADIVIIPACMNRNLTKNLKINLIAAPIVNDLCAAAGTNISGALSNQMSFFGQDIPDDIGAESAFGTVGMGLSLDTSAAAARDEDNNLTGSFEDYGVAQYGNIVLYNTSDTSLDWEPWAKNLDGIKEILNKGKVNLEKNLCIGIIGNVNRIPNTNIDFFFGYKDEESTKNHVFTGDNLDNAVRYALTDRWGSTNTNISESGAAFKNGMLAAATTAQLYQMWGVNVGNGAPAVNDSFTVSLSDVDGTSDETSIINNDVAAYVSGSVLCAASEMNAFLKFCKSDLGQKLAWAEVGVGAIFAVVAIATGGVVAVVGGLVLLVAGIVTGIANLIGNNEAALAYTNKIRFGTTVAFMNGKYKGLNTGRTPVTSVPEYIKTTINSINDIDELGNKLASLTKDAYASLIANGYVNGLKPTSSFNVDKTYEMLLDGKEPDDLLEANYPEEDDKVNKYLAHSVSVVALANPSVIDAKKYLCLIDDSVFDTYADILYIDYLKWYGFTDKNGPENTLNIRVLSALGGRLTNDSDNIYNEIFGDAALTEEQKQQKVQDYTYKALAPTAEGVEYRNQILVSGMQEWLATEYNQVCFGNDNNHSVGTSGFLQMSSYSENFMTSWIISNWNRVLVITTYISIIIIAIIGAIKGKKLTWIIATLMSTILLLVILPSTGEITPYVCDKVVQSMFQKGAQYWSINEGIEGEYLSNQYAESDLDSATLKLIKAASITQTSKSLMIKHDISRKVMPTAENDTTKLMRLNSAKWVLPTLLRQISADEPENKYNYVYNTLDDARGKMKDLFLYYNNDNGRLSVKYGERSMLESGGYKNIEGGYWYDYDKLHMLWSGWTDIVNEGWKEYQSTSLCNNIKECSDHLRFGYLARLKYPASKYIGFTLGKMTEGTISIESIDKFQSNIAEGVNSGKYNNDTVNTDGTGNIDDWYSLVNDIVTVRLNSYKESGASQEFGYLYMTEDLIPYFYLVVKDTYSYNWDLGGIELAQAISNGKSDNYGTGHLATLLLGSVNKETKQRNSLTLVTVGDKSVTRDFLDLQTLFTNYIPYMVQIMSITGGTDGTDGMLKGRTMESFGYSIYGDSEAAWLFRSNWVIKLISSSNYSSGAYVRDKDGKKYFVEHQVFPQNYPSNRPMVFSEAQMLAQGLEETDLSAVELACVETNRQVAEKWEMLVNYVNTDGISREIIEEQMALEATMVFNKNMVDDNYISAEVALYPTSFDLRAINFDSVLKLLVISDNYNNASLTQDAIYTIMADKGTGGGILALIAAWLCQVGVPFMRNITLGLLFYCALCCAIYNILNDSRAKAKATLGGTLSNTVYMVITIMFYCIFWLLITRAGGDLILTKDGFNTGTSNIIWKLVIIVIAAVLYGGISFLFWTKVILRDIPNMGMSILQQYAHNTYVKVNKFANKIKSKLGSKKAAEDRRESAAREIAAQRAENSGSEMNANVKITDGSVVIKNDKNNPVPFFDVNEVTDPVYIEDDDKDNSGFIEEEAEEENKSSEK